jgi:isoquinoline 1-oxidoreductase beta subunit
MKDFQLSRRGFLAGATGLTAMIALPPRATRAQSADQALSVNVFVNVGTDDRITIFAPAAEMGQGVMTACPLILAEELDADWSKVAVEQSPVGQAYGNPGFGNLMVTGGSRTVQGYWPLLRKSGAQVRRVLMQAAADDWGVSLDGVSTEPSVIVGPDGQRMTYGEAAAIAEAPETAPEIADADLKPRDLWRLIGNTVPRVDIPEKTRGAADFGIDRNVEGQKYVTILRAPVNGASPASVDDAAALEVPGVEQVLELPYGVAVVGEHYDAVLRGRRALSVEWTDEGKAQGFDSEAITQKYLEMAADRSIEGAVHALEGDPDAAIEGAARRFTADFTSDFLHHATLEPMNCLASVTEDGIEIWAPTQAPSVLTFAAAGALQRDPSTVTVHQTLLGGGFGRKVDTDFGLDAVMVSDMIGAPAKVIWTREDDVQHDKYRPLTAQRIEAGVDEDGTILGWSHRAVGQSIAARFRPDAFEASGGKDESFVEGGHTFYALGDHRLDFVHSDDGIDTGFWRAVGAGYTKFAVEQVIDEIATDLGRDPLQYRIDLLAEDPRGQAVLRRVRDMSGWPRAAEGNRAYGVAFSDAWNSRIAEVAEIELDRESGYIRVTNVWAAVDPGVAVQPDQIVAQVEGGVVFGISGALKERITVKDGAVQQNNFYDYELLRLSETPQVAVEIVESVDQPGGMGEVSLPPVGAAIANAVAQATGKRVRALPMSPERVKAVLES